MTSKFQTNINPKAFKKQTSFSLKTSSEKKYNVKFDNEDLELVTALQDKYDLKNKSDLIEVILSNFLKNSLHEEGVSHDVALAISLVADAYTFKNSSDFKIVSWENEVISSKHGRDSILSITEHSESYLQVGIKLLQFCERENLIDTPQYKALFKSLEVWNSKLKGKE